MKTAVDDGLGTLLFAAQELAGSIEAHVLHARVAGFPARACFTRIVDRDAQVGELEIEVDSEGRIPRDLVIAHRSRMEAAFVPERTGDYEFDQHFTVGPWIDETIPALRAEVRAGLEGLHRHGVAAL